MKIELNTIKGNNKEETQHIICLLKLFVCTLHKQNQENRVTISLDFEELRHYWVKASIKLELIKGISKNLHLSGTQDKFYLIDKKRGTKKKRKKEEESDFIPKIPAPRTCFP